MNTEAANKLLKTLEEPMPNTYFIMVSHNPNKIITTIISRCRIVELPPIKREILSGKLQEQFNITQKEGDFWATCSGGSYSEAVNLIEKEEE
jgi:DNA polymerase-3 subunit delta'